MKWLACCWLGSQMKGLCKNGQDHPLLCWPEPNEKETALFWIRLMEKTEPRCLDYQRCGVNLIGITTTCFALFCFALFTSCKSWNYHIGILGGSWDSQPRFNCLLDIHKHKSTRQMKEPSFAKQWQMWNQRIQQITRRLWCLWCMVIEINSSAKRKIFKMVLSLGWKNKYSKKEKSHNGLLWLYMSPLWKLGVSSVQTLEALEIREEWGERASQIRFSWLEKDFVGHKKHKFTSTKNVFCKVLG